MDRHLTGKSHYNIRELLQHHHYKSPPRIFSPCSRQFLSLISLQNMINLVSVGEKLKHLWHSSRTKLACVYQSACRMLSQLFNFLLNRVNPFCIQLFYFSMLSFVGYLALKISKTRPENSSSRPKDLDLFFTSVSATTVSSMSTVEMEVFSNTQLVILTILMLFGGEVFFSLLELQFLKLKFPKQTHLIHNNRINFITINSNNSSLNSVTIEQIELGNLVTENGTNKFSEDLKYSSIKFLGYVVLGYFVVVHFLGSSFVYLYISLVSSARNVLKNKKLHPPTFSIFLTVSTFANCGFVPTNENMMVFKRNSGFLLILIPLILLGNTLFPPCIRFATWVLERISKREEFSYILKSSGEMEYDHLLSGFHSVWLVATVFGFLLVQIVLFCAMEWNNSEAMTGLNSYQKFVGSLFQVANSRHTGELIFDLSVLSQAVLVLFVVMMYLPPHTSFLPKKECEEIPENSKKGVKKTSFWEHLTLSQLSYLVIFIVLICVIEREKLKTDPLNFNILNIVIEVISAYGNVGFSTGYSCRRRLKADNNCKDMMYGFVGRWSDKGKFILIVVMFFGRLKKFTMKGGTSWKLL